MKKTKILFLITLLSVQVFSQFPENIFPDDDYYPFVHGVASGDPLSDRVIIWTRISPPSEPPPELQVLWEFSEFEDFSILKASGEYPASADQDWTVKIDVPDLSPATRYYYRFLTPSGNFSRTGRTQTLPAPGSDPGSLRFAVGSCSSIYSGFFNAYRQIALREDIDLMIHLGDYIYDTVDPDEQIRVPDPWPIDPSNLSEFRSRHEYYLLDPDLRAARQMHPWIQIWDNHDLGSSPLDNGSIQAFLEWNPLRLPDPTLPESIYRNFRFGNLAELMMIDIDIFKNLDEIEPGVNSLLGNEQFEWLDETLNASENTWKLIGNQKLMTTWSAEGFPDFVSEILPIEDGIINVGGWANFPQERERLYELISSSELDNIMMLSGDLHISMAMDMVPDITLYDGTTGEGSIGVEYLPTSISRGNIDEAGVPPIISAAFVGLSKDANPQQQYLELNSHGYGLLDIGKDSITAEFWYCPILEISDEHIFAGGNVMRKDENHWQRYRLTEPSSRDFASSVPYITSASKNPYQVSIEPNPAEEFLSYELLSSSKGDMSINIYNLSGEQQIETLNVENVIPGVPVSFEIDISNLSKGLYLMQTSGKDYAVSSKFLKVH